VLDGTIAPVSVAAVVMARLVYLIKATDSEDVFLSLLDEVKASIKNEYVPPDVVLN
jgi:hypothetical protein